MGFLGAIRFSIALVSLIQIPFSNAGDCDITYAESLGPSNIFVKWVPYPSATAYILDIRVTNSTEYAPVVAVVSGNAVERKMFGLQPGKDYTIYLKVLQFTSVVCSSHRRTKTVPDTPQFTEGFAPSSTSISLIWTEVLSAENFFLMVISQSTGKKLNLTYHESHAEVTNLQPFTNYDCYVYAANEAGVGYASKVRTVTTLIQPPHNISAVQTGRTTADLSWNRVKDVLVYRVRVEEPDNPDAPTREYNISNTRMSLVNIMPCSKYLIQICSYSLFLQPSEPSIYTYTTNALNPVSQVNVNYACATNSAIVMWMPVNGADMYKAKAVTEGGAPLSCNGTALSCNINGVLCGKSYEVHVTPISENCENQVNSTFTTFQSAPCPPQNLSLWRDCSSEVILFSWGKTNNAQTYKAKSIDSKGVVKECLTQNNSCYFTHARCGRDYTFSVFSTSGTCDSAPSHTVEISTAPCIPHNVKTIANCNSNALVSKWDSADGALNYTVEAYGNQENSYYNCTSSSNSCSFGNMNCGEALTIYITSHNEHCSSPRRLAPVAQMVPCAPENVSASTDCEANSINVTWGMSGGAVFYMAKAVDDAGSEFLCNTLDPTCIFEGLSCSTNYTIHVIASNIVCNSSSSDTVLLETVACPPRDIAWSLDCANNEALVSWVAEPRIRSFTVTALDELNGLVSCSSTSSSCKLSNLECDQVYTVTVGNHDSICPVINSEPVYKESVPCGPNVTAAVDCETRELTAAWDAVVNASSYNVQLSNGTATWDLDVTSPAYTSGDLKCGQTYTLDVCSVIGSCVSRPTQVTVTQAPCPPTNIAVVPQDLCPRTQVDVTWQSSLGAVSYEVAAVSSAASQQRCNTTETTCFLNGLVCGQTYNITATARGQQCSSETSAQTQLVTEPCPPTDLEVTLDCASSSAVLSWSRSSNAASYTGKAVSWSGESASVTCDAGAALSCNLTALECGQTYNFSVTASDGDCESAESEAVTLSTAPCTVTSVANDVDCVTNSLITSWAPSDDELTYTVKAQQADGSALLCSTNASSCVLADLPCGTQYNVSVVAISPTCTGQSSEPQLVNTAPCVPTNIAAQIQCADNSLHSSWDLAAGASSYVAQLTGPGGFSDDCRSSTIGFCSFHGLTCAQTYTLTVLAGNDQCNSSSTLSVKSAPCLPTNVASSLDCESGVATVDWTASAGVNTYTVLAQANDHQDQCVATSPSCQLHNLRCGNEYAVIILAGDDACNSSILTAVTITTAPCAPVMLDASLSCATNVALVPWVMDTDATSVTVHATSRLGHATSCNSTDDSSCALSDLQCGNTYNVTAVAQGVQCASEASAPFDIITAPCTPQNVDITNSCDTGIAIVSWDETLGRKSFHVTATSPTDVKTCSTSTTIHCDISSMVCGQTYNFSVFAVADHCNSSVPAFLQMQTAPCAPQNVTASLLCDNNTASVSWAASTGAVSYTVTALGRSNQVKECSSNGTTCDIPHMECGETYRITVTPFSEDCQGYESQAISYLAGPCPPTQFSVTRQCNGNVVVLNWTAVPNAEYYEATGVDLVTLHTHNCSSSSTTCSIQDLHCGETVAISVLTRERGCFSEPNQPFMFEAVICPPANLQAVTTCSNNDITVSWDTSPKTGVTYYVDATQFGSGSSQRYTTATTSSVITGLQCGELYTLQASAQYQECTSTPSWTINAQTAPCPPTDLAATTDCGTGTGTLTWTQSVRATHYTATFSGSHGNVSSCTTNSTTCTVELDCGTTYTVSLVASSAMCDSSAAASLQFNSAPCLPKNVSATLDCEANSFAVTWSGEPQDGPFTALAIGSDGSRVSCNSPSAQCAIVGLKCGVLYGIVVTTSNVDCGVINESNYKVQSAPCKPTAVSVDLDCNTNNAVVGWAGTGPDQEQKVIARDVRGNTISCISNTSHCSFTGLSCGLSYNISVVGTSSTCTSAPSYGPMLHTAPCLPTQVKTAYDCQADITIVTWDTASGATSYTVNANGSLGYDATCQNTDNNCDFASLACGQEYNITVQAANSECISAVSEAVVSTSGPCPHSDVGTSLDCAANIVAVSWTPGRGIFYYNATASALDTVGTQSCSTNASSCNISTLLCGERYSVSVTGQGLTCPSPAQQFQIVQAAPCPPTLLSVDSSCDSNDIAVNWATSKGAVTYRAAAENSEGTIWTCESGDARCEILGLPCGQTFSVYVAGVDGKCVGARSNMQVHQTAPCVPQNITANMDCPAKSLNVSWAIEGYMSRAIEFYLFDDNGTLIFCIDIGCAARDGKCMVPEETCGMNYNMKLKAVGDKCNSSRSAAHPFSTAPCSLSTSDLAVDVACDSGRASVSWANGAPGVLYSVSAVGDDGAMHECNGSSGDCDLGLLPCGSEYNATVTPSRDGCVGISTAPIAFRTVPCVPQLKAVEIDCLTNSVWVMGSESAGAEDYVITATDDAGGVQTFECNSTSEDLCFLPTLACSKNFTFTIQARNGDCSSAPSNARTIETGPCSPQGVISHVDCEANLVSISWDTVPGAVSYTATLEDFNGGTDCCTSANNSCDISDLPCGQMYFLLVTAEGRTCNSSETRGMARTVPCVPENLDYTLSCTSNLASMSWNHSLGGQLYRVTAVSQDDHVDRCSSHENHCELANLECGKTYSVAVTAEDMDCNSKASNNVSIKTAPCTPQDLSSVVSCGNSTMLVSWADSEGADSYLATVEDSYGQVTSCQATTEGQCSVGTLGCGLIYHVSLVASDGHCDSLSTAVVDTPSVPCVPNNIKAEFDCFLNSALVSWYPSDGAILYVVTGTSVSGHVITCSTAATTHCELEDLECGDSYTVQVLAVGESCNATGQMNGTMGTGPCVPEILSTDYSLSIGQALWARDPGAERYTVEAVTDQGLVSDCATNDTYCALYNMECSQTYTFTLTAYNDQCPSGIAANQTNSMTTEPCPPKNIQVDVQLPTNLAVVQWEPSVGAVSYVATLSGRNGETLQCQTVETFCEVDALECGVIYYAQVIAVGATMNSTESETIQVEAGPCPVENVTVLVDYYNSSAVIAWEPALGATSYEMIAVATSGHQVSCGGSEFDTKCEVVDLECGQTYSITAVSINHQGSVKTETGVTFQTRPCKPENVGVDFQCATWTATLFWADEDGVVLYLGTAVSSSGVKTVCNTSASPCLFTNLDCGETYDFYVEASNDVAISEPSETVSTGTGPCTASDLAAQSSCYDPMVELSWSDTAGAELYTVDVAGNLGYVTSLQTTNTTVEVELPCGQIYTVTVRASDESCPGTVSQSVQYQSGPCVPRDVKSYTACENNIGAVSWAPADGADFYLAFAVGESGSTNNCTTNETSCTWDDLQCGDVYEVVVMAFNEECESLESNTTYIRMASCIPQNVVATFNCSMKVGSLSWDAVSTADFYIATAQSDSGHTIQQSTNDTWAYFSEFSCGVDYFLSVQSVDAHCTSVPSPAAKLQSEPCPPTGVSSYMNCIANIAVVSWNSSVGGEYYAATVTSEEGNTQTCWSDQEQCGIPNLRCGQSYSVSVVASNQACNSDPSPESQLMSVPCVPTNVHVSTMDCSKNEATVTWDASQGALMYTVHAESANNTSSSCETDTLSCMLTGLMCGQAYSVQVVARDNICASLPSPATLFESVPCVPDMGAVVLDCATDTFIADWMFSDGALSYVATALSSGGDVSTCSSNNTNCELGGLQCGQTYTVTVQAENTLCRSLPSNGVMSESAPCRPQGLTTSVNCSTNSIAVQWQQTAGVSYYVEALGLEEDEASCTSSSDRCVLEGLLCGFTYNVSVVAYNDLCNVSSDVLQQNSVPCVPQNVRAALDCESKDVQLTWENTRGALTYRSVAQSVGGFTEVCDSSDTWCTFSQLLCDMNYTFTVAASDGACSSHASAAVEIYTGPCEPQHVMADMFCNNHTGVVSWEEGDGVTSYSVQGYGPDGHSVSCSTEGTSCQLPSMHCGQMYNLTVTAIDGRCNNSQAHVSLNSVPCTPTNVGASLRCSTNTTAVTWERASGADTYTAVALSSDGSHTSTCGNNETHCDLSALQCGTVYNVTVMGEDHVCFGVKSAPASVHTAPCTPQNVTVTEQCAAASMTVSWAANPDAEYFLVSGMSSSGAPLTCNATSTSCSFSALPCGQSYNFIVIAFRDDCPSAPSVPVTTSSAPCVPTNIYAHLDCVTNAAWITFTESAGATGYRVFARAEGVAHNSSGSSASSPCSVPDLKCSTVYNIQLTAENGHCASTPGPDYRLETAPCALTAINATTECDSSVITVQWKVSENMPLYVATAEGHDMSLISCNSTSNSCQLQDAACGMNYTVIVSTSSDKCSSLRSPSYHVQTPPCAPQNVTAVQSCNDSGVIVSYDLSPVPARYVVRVSGAGFSETHNTTLDHCTLSGLPCGQQFQVDVYAFTENCTSPDTTVTYESGPCPPSGLSVVYDCANLSAHLTWDPSQGAGEFFASAQAPTLAPLYCSSADLSCTIDGLVCGQNYSFGVEASDYVCNSSSAAPVHLGSVPCAPTNIRVRMQLMEGSFWAMIWWDRVTCPDVEYQVTIGGHINDNPQTQMQITSYWLERNYFEVPLPTSTTYKINVYARNLGGVSQPSFTKTGVTVPTPPQNVEYDPISSELTWDASVLANLYQVYEVTPLGDIGLCETTTLACSAPGVDQADLRVTASNAAGTSLPSAPTVARRRRDLSGAIMDMDDALVPPTAVSVTPSETSLAVQWSAVRGAAEYVVVVDENKGNLESLVQTTAETELAVHGLQPGTVYCLKVAAKNISQQSLYTENKCISTLKETE